jgi:FemAB-related protein (PEP-CTERM system-associated)
MAVATDVTERIAPQTGSPMVIEQAVAGQRADWDAFVRARPDASGYHEWTWRDVIERSLGHSSIYLIARRSGAIVGVLPLIETRSVVFGHSLTSLPFVNYGGILADSPDVAAALVAHARDLGRARQCDHVELRHIDRQFEDLPVRTHKVTMRLPLAADLWDRFDRKVRNQIRKAEKSGLVAERGGEELLPAFYQVFARNMRDLGTPVYGRRLFSEVLAAFGARARIVVVRMGDRPIAAALTYRTRTLMEVPWASSIRDFNALCPNHLMYWRAIEWAIGDGCTIFDFGRSTPHEGTYNFKRQWGAEPVTLHWEYPYLRGGDVPDHGPSNPKFRLAIAAWQRCPLWLANTIGPHIVRAIP